MKVVLDWLCRLCARFDPLATLAVVITTWSSQLLSRSDLFVPVPETSGIWECDQRCPKTRELVTTLWGGAVTLFMLSFDSWELGKSVMCEDRSTLDKVVVCFTIFLAISVTPVSMLGHLVEFAAWSYHMRRTMPGFTFLSLFSPWTKHPAKIVCGCEVVITVPTTISIPDSFIESTLPRLVEAVVIGRGQGESRETRNIRLGYKGKEVLLQMDVLPPYDQLKVLQGSSGLATTISAMQSMGYIYGVVVRTMQGLPVSPIEVVALMLSILILIKALLHNIVNTCYRPFRIYLTDVEAQTFVVKCEKYTAHEVPRSHVVGPSVVMVLLVSSVVIYYIIHMLQTTRTIVVVPILLALVGFYLQLISIWALTMNNPNQCVVQWIAQMTAMVQFASYILALAATIKFWKVDRLNAKTSSMLAQIFPYIG